MKLLSMVLPLEKSRAIILKNRSVTNVSVKSLFTQKQNLHSIIYFLADKPGKKNLDPSVPLVGTSSYKTLLSWCADMDLDVSRMRMYNQSDAPFDGLSGVSLNIAIKKKHIKVIALGVEAKKYLLAAGIEEFFCLPHPSPKNLLLNDKDFVDKTLEQCRSYIYND